MIEGRLTDQGEDPMSVQMAFSDTEAGVVIELRNADGIFLTIDPEDEEREEPGGGERGTSSPLPGSASESDGEPPREDPRIAELRGEVAQLTEQNTTLSLEVSGLREEVKSEKQRYRDMWRLNCQQLLELEEMISERDGEIEALRGCTLGPSGVHSPARGPPVYGIPVPRTGAGALGASVTYPSPSLGELHALRRGKALPIDPFDGETGSIAFEDWLPTLQRAAAWNNWSDDDCLVQLAGHLRKRALEEWNLLTEDEKKTFTSATEALHNRLDPMCRVLAAQDFRLALQRNDEPVTEYIRQNKHSSVCQEIDQARLVKINNVL
jgi:hypothetical protein